MPTYEKADLQRFSPGVKCSARSQRTGKQCNAWAVRGANVCRVHGASAPQVKAAAKRRLDQAADVLVQRLLGFALDGQCEDNTALRAIIAALDRAGIVVPNTIDVAIGPRPFEEVFDSIATTSRAESRAQRGMPAELPPAALEAATLTSEGPALPLGGPVEPSTGEVGVVVSDEFPKWLTPRWSTYHPHRPEGRTTDCSTSRTP